MAEEKKIADEMLTDDELDEVSGGTIDETAADTRVLKKLGLRIDGRSAEDLIEFSKFSEAAIEVSQIFKRFSIRVDQYWGPKTNKYYRDGQEISRELAFKIVAKNLGKPMPNLS